MNQIFDRSLLKIRKNRIANCRHSTIFDHVGNDLLYRLDHYNIQEFDNILKEKPTNYDSIYQFALGLIINKIKKYKISYESNFNSKIKDDIKRLGSLKSNVRNNGYNKE